MKIHLFFLVMSLTTWTYSKTWRYVFPEWCGKKHIQPWDSVPFFHHHLENIFGCFFPTTEQAKSELMPTEISRGLDRQLLDLLQKCTRENNLVKRWAQPTPTWSLAAKASKSDRIPIGKQLVFQNHHCSGVLAVKLQGCSVVFLKGYLNNCFVRLDFWEDPFQNDCYILGLPQDAGVWSPSGWRLTF